MAIVKNVSNRIITLDDFWNEQAHYTIRPGQTQDILDNVYVTSKQIKRLLKLGQLTEELKPQFASDEVGDWWDKEVLVDNIPGTKLDNIIWGMDYEGNVSRICSVNERGELIVDTELRIDEATLNISNVFPARYYEGQYPFEPGTDVLLSANAYGELELAREYFDENNHWSVNVFGPDGEPFSCASPLHTWICGGVGHDIENPTVSTTLATDDEGRLVRDTTPLHGTNATTELGFNALDQLVRIRKYIKGIWQTQAVTGSDIADYSIVRTRTFNAYV